MPNKTPLLNTRLLSSCLTFLALGLIVLMAKTGHAEGDSPAPAAWTVAVEGDVAVKRHLQSSWGPVAVNDNFFGGDSISVSQSGRATLRLSNNTLLRLDRQTTITLAEEKNLTNRLLDLIKGTAYFLTRSPRAFKVGTPFMNAGIEGTEFMLQATDEESTALLFEGHLKLENDQGRITLAPSEGAASRAGTATQRLLSVSTRDSVLWTLYYPHLALKQASPATPPPEWQSTIAALLKHGDHAAAQDEIKKALAAEPGKPEALAYASIIALAANQVEEATALAKQASINGPDNPQASLALSYAYQGSFLLEEALAALQRAIIQAPDASLLKAREAELLLGLGRVGDAQAAADRAVQLDPNEPRAQTMKGFTALSAGDLESARAALDQGTKLEPGDPLPHIGLGMLMIRQHELAAGREELELAAILDPRNPITRGYLGRAYDEEGRTGRALQQFTLAREFDPNDPTPGFYEAVALQRRGEPLAALTPLQESIAKSDNRATVRSRLLLDEDYAARSAALARAYTDAGFPRLGLSEAAASVTLDESSPTGHRFLSEAFAELPRHQIARVSELLQSRLLARGIAAPVQAEMTESGLYIANGSGPSSVTPEELTPLFRQNGFSLLTSGVTGSEDTLGDQVAVAGEWDRISMNVAQFHFQTDGYRLNADQQSDITLVDAVARISPKTAVHAEYRNRRLSRGDLELRFDPEDFSTSLRHEDDRTGSSIGFRHDLSPASVLLGSFMQNHYDVFSREELPDFGPLDIVRQDDGDGSELRYSWRGAMAGLTAGAGYFDFIRQEEITLSPLTETTVRHGNGYAYGHYLPAPSLDLIVGSSFDRFHSQDIDADEVNPKAGLIWSPLPEVTLRAAAFRTFTRTLLNDQTLEPTQIAGFNQFYDDMEGAVAWRYGVGLDFKPGRGVFLGVEFSQRDLEVPLFGIELPLERLDFAWREQNADTYIYWTPATWLGLRAEYHEERFDRQEGSWSLSEVETRRLPLGATFFWRGFSFGLTETHVRQTGRFYQTVLSADGPVSAYTTGSDSFWLLDGRISSRLFQNRGVMTLEARNLLDANFRYQDMDPENPMLQPGRRVLLKVSFLF